MASNWSVTFAIAAILLPTVAMATDYIVGDEMGWTVKYDYQNWAKDKVFRVGDKLVFQYKPPNHNVVKVNGTEFKNCTVSKLSKPLTSGNDTITLASPGRKWYICGKADHCAAGQKVVITVVSDGPAPAPTPGNSDNSAAFGIMSSASSFMEAAIVFIAMMVMV